MNESTAPESSGSSADFAVSAQEAGLRLDVVLSARFQHASRASLQTVIRRGAATVNGLRRKPADTVCENDRIHVDFPPEDPEEILPWSVDLDILHEDEDMLVVNKPPGLVVHPTRGHQDDTLVNVLLAHDSASFEAMIDAERRPGIVHRLDKDTSGVLVVARCERARQTLKAAFAERTVEKTYLAVVLGEFDDMGGRIESPIGRHPVNRKKMTVVREGGKPAITLYRVLGNSRGLSLVEVRILTGRTHQIRVHFACERHPVFGDALYGGRQRGLDVEAPRQMLHAWKLALPHPSTGLWTHFIAPPPEDFLHVLAEADLPRIAPTRYPPVGTDLNRTTRE